MPFVEAPAYPTYNRRLVDWSSVFFSLFNTRLLGIKDVSASDSLEPGEARGTHPQALGTTVGTYSAEGSFTCYVDELRRIIEAMGDGYMEQTFNIVLKYRAKKGDPVSTRELLGCRIKKIDESHSQSNEPLVAKVELYVTVLVRDGVNPLENMIGV